MEGGGSNEIVLHGEAANAAANAIRDSISQARKSGKDAASDVSSWARGHKPLPGESGKDFADRLMDDKYGPGNYDKGPGTEHNRIKKRGDRGPR